jgi:hypothetical protein
MDVFNINCQSYVVIETLQLFLQKYITLIHRDGWGHLSEDVEFVGPVEELPMCELEY